VSCDLLMCGWKGYAATRVYLCKNERMHYLNLCGHPVPERLMPNNSRRGKPTDGANGSSAEGDGATSTQSKTPDEAPEVHDELLSMQEESKFDDVTAMEVSEAANNTIISMSVVTSSSSTEIKGQADVITEKEINNIKPVNDLPMVETTVQSKEQPAIISEYKDDEKLGHIPMKLDGET